MASGAGALRLAGPQPSKKRPRRMPSSKSLSLHDIIGGPPPGGHTATTPHGETVAIRSPTRGPAKHGYSRTVGAVVREEADEHNPFTNEAHGLEVSVAPPPHAPATPRHRHPLPLAAGSVASIRHAAAARLQPLRRSKQCRPLRCHHRPCTSALEPDRPQAQPTASGQPTPATTPSGR